MYVCICMYVVCFVKRKINQSINHIYLSLVTVQKTKYNKAKTVNRHGNGLPEKPTAHQADRLYDNML